jgi:PPOX class probable F420-dependent enzyme
MRYAARRALRVLVLPRWPGPEPLNLTQHEARRRFSGAVVARLATVTETVRPHLVPITFAVDGDRIYSVVDAKPKTTVHGLRRLRNIRFQPQVSVLADHYADDWAALWWARADGVARLLDPKDAEAAHARRLLAARYPQYRDAPPPGAVIAVDVTRWSGWAGDAAGPAA